MKKSRYSDEQIVQILREADKAPIADDVQVRKIRGLLLKFRRRDDLPPIRRVVDLANAFKMAGFQYNVSAASKLLWLSSRAPIKIYDERAWDALRRLGAKPGPKGDYAKYFECWHEKFSEFQMEIEDAVSELPSLREFLPKPSPTSKVITNVTNNAWFKERVFDIYLWELGREG
jgi:hypothetical protein